MNDDTLIMSEELVGQIPDLDEENLGRLISNLIIVSIHDENTGFEISNPVSAILFSNEPEIEFKISIAEAINILTNKEKLHKIPSIKILHDNKVSIIEGEFYLDLAKILDINLNDQTCILALGLKKKP